MFVCLSECLFHHYSQKAEPIIVKYWRLPEKLIKAILCLDRTKVGSNFHIKNFFQKKKKEFFQKKELFSKNSTKKIFLQKSFFFGKKYFFVLFQKKYLFRKSTNKYIFFFFFCKKSSSPKKITALSKLFQKSSFIYFSIFNQFFP